MQERPRETKEPEIPVNPILSLPYEKLTQNYDQKKDEEMCLLASKYKVGVEDDDILILAFDAAFNGWIRTLQYLLLTNKCDINEDRFWFDNYQNFNLLLAAFWHHQKGIIQLLLDHPRLSSASLDYFRLESFSLGGHFKENPLIFALMNRDLELLRKLIDKGANPDAKKAFYEFNAYMSAEYGSAMEYAIQQYKIAASHEDQSFYFEAMKHMLPHSKIDITTLDPNVSKLLSLFVKIQPKVEVVVEDQKTLAVSAPGSQQKVVDEKKKSEEKHDEQDILDLIQTFINENRVNLKATKGRSIFGALAPEVGSIEAEIKKTNSTPKQKLTAIELHLLRVQAKHNMASAKLQHRFYYVVFQGLKYTSVTDKFTYIKQNFQNIIKQPAAAVSPSRCCL